MELHIPDLPPTEVDQHFSWTCFMIESGTRFGSLRTKVPGSVGGPHAPKNRKVFYFYGFDDDVRCAQVTN